MNWAVVMAGGYGERFWPRSRRKQPKQLLPIVGVKTMIQQTVERVRPLVDEIMVVTNQEQVPLVRKQLPRVKHIIAEPMGRNTAPAIGVAAAVIGKQGPDAVMAVLPADPYITDTEGYRRVVGEALKLAAAEHVLITIGIKPTGPHTGYGYIKIKSGGFDRDDGHVRFRQVEQFVEKPNAETAEMFFHSGEYRWNAGMFVWHFNSIRDAFQEYQPALWDACLRIQKAAGTKSFVRALAREYPKMEKIAVDYAIMEKAKNVVVANGDFDWDDVGDWPAIGRHYEKDSGGNVARGEFVEIDSANCIVLSDKKHLVATVGVRDLVIVHTDDATLVCHKDQAQKVRDVVKKLAVEKKYKRLL